MDSQTPLLSMLPPPRHFKGARSIAHSPVE